MLRDLIATDVEAICEINKEALGYAFSSEETASQLARLSKDPHHFLLGYQDDAALLGVDSTILDLSVSPAKILRQGKITKEDLLAALPELTIE